MKKSKELITIELAEFVACYMYETKQNEITIEELNNAYKNIYQFLSKRKEVTIFYSPEYKLEQIPCFVPMFEVDKNSVKLLNHLDYQDAYIVLVKGLYLTKKKTLTEAIKKYVKDLNDIDVATV